MVLFDDTAHMSFSRFGIDIPALDSRKVRTMAALKSHSALAKRVDEWWIPRVSEEITRTDLIRVHDPDYAGGFFDPREVEERLITAYELRNPDGTYHRYNPENAQEALQGMVPRLLRILAGTTQASRVALDTGFCHILGGGTHHAHYDFGHGFCPLNDSVIAIQKLRSEGRIDTAWVIDLDAHKGDGTAALTAGNISIATLSIHMADGWPLDGSLPLDHPSYTPSTVDIPVAEGEEPRYLRELEGGLERLWGVAPAPDLAIVLAGADPWEGDALPSTQKIQLPFDGITERDRLTYLFLEEKAIPSAWLTAGGYGEGAWRIHAEFLTWVLSRRLGI